MNVIETCWRWVVVIAVGIACLPQLARDAVEEMEAEEAAERGQQ